MKLPLYLVAPFLIFGCSYYDPLERFRPLFVRLDEASMPAKARYKLDQAKWDFALARKGRPLCYAKQICEDTSAGTKTYQACGYKIIIHDGGPRRHVGQEIIIESSVTGTRPYHYTEISQQWD